MRGGGGGEVGRLERGSGVWVWLGHAACGLIPIHPTHPTRPQIRPLCIHLIHHQRGVGRGVAVVSAVIGWDHSEPRSVAPPPPPPLLTDAVVVVVLVLVLVAVAVVDSGADVVLTARAGERVRETGAWTGAVTVIGAGAGTGTATGIGTGAGAETGTVTGLGTGTGLGAENEGAGVGM